MMPRITNAEQVARDFSESLRTVAKLKGFSERTVTIGEVGTILRACVGKTKIADPQKADIRSRQKALKSLHLTTGSASGNYVSVNSGLRGPAGFVWFKTDGPHPRSKVKGGAKITGRRFQLAGRIPPNGGAFDPGKFHFKPADWFAIQAAAFDASAAIQKAVPLGRASAGLAAQSWVQMGDDLGIALEDFPGGASSSKLAKARAAIASNGRVYTNGIGTEQYEENKSYFATLINQLPYWPKIQLDTVMLTVLAGRAKYFQQNVARAVFASHAETVRAYPWMKLVGEEAS